MLRLLPETLQGGLFPGSSWLGGGRSRASVEHAAGADASSLLAGLGSMLSQLPKESTRRRRLDLVVSDSVAAIAVMPWQEELKRRDELDAYAFACHERQGRTIDDGWVLQTAVRTFRGAGLSFALPQAWLSELIAVCEKYQVRLRTVLPASAAAYWHNDVASAGLSLLLLSEAGRVTALVYEGTRLLRVDVQPVIADAGAASSRLLLRIGTGCKGISKVYCWSAAHVDAQSQIELVGTRMPGTAVLRLERDTWR